MDQIKKIHNLSATELEPQAQDYYHNIDTRLGDFWCSGRTIVKDVNYKAPLPPGIHIGAGIAALTTQSKSAGSHSFNGAIASYFIQPEGFQEQVTTTVKKGRALSCGLFLSCKICQNLPDEVSLLTEKFDDTGGFRGSANVSTSVIERLCTPIESCYQGNALTLIGEARVFELLATVITAFTTTKNMATAKVKHVLLARDFIESHLMDSFTLQTIAKQAGSNVRSLTQAFRQHFGLSINQYMTERRMEKAFSFLEQGLSVSQTAYLVGYSLPYFSEKFQQRFGISASHVSNTNLIKITAASIMPVSLLASPKS
jgi:AraC-like DNA-binding protein